VGGIFISFGNIAVLFFVLFFKVADFEYSNLKGDAAPGRRVEKEKM
jgi:hypothetical protein